MAMQHVGSTQNLGGLQHGAGKQRKAFGIIVIVAERSTIQTFAIEIRGIIDEIELHSGVNSAVEHGAKTIAIVEGHGDAGNDDARILQMGLPITGQKDSNPQAEMGQGRRQCADDIRQSARLRIRNALGCSKSYVHESSRRDVQIVHTLAGL